MEQDFKNEIYCMEWDSLNELLYCGEKNGQINVWDPKLVNFSYLILNLNYKNMIIRIH